MPQVTMSEKANTKVSYAMTDR